MIRIQCGEFVSAELRRCLRRPVPSTFLIGGNIGRAELFRWIAGVLTVAALGAALLVTAGCHSHADASQQEMGAQAERPSGAGESSKSGHPKVCSLLSPQEVSAATNLSIVKAAGDEDDELCNYTTADDGISTVSVQVDWEGGKFALQAGSKLMENAAGGTQFRTPVTGIGDEAFVLGVGPQQQNQINRDMPAQLKSLSSLTTGPLMFRKNDAMVTVTANFIDNKFEAEKQLAAKIAGRL